MISFSRVFIVVLAVCFAACGDEPKAPEALGSSDIAGYRNWPLRKLAVHSDLGHDAAGDVYANHIVQNYLAVAAGELTSPTAVVRYPEGSIFVKDVWNAERSLRYVAVMRKLRDVPDGAESYGGWVWSQRKVSTARDVYQAKDACHDCHAKANSPNYRDGVFVFPTCREGVICPE